jgi:hypothetical protein
VPLWKNASNIRISSAPKEMTDGLFGQVILWVFEVLPYLYAEGIFPDWEICTAHYGTAPDGLTIPGALDLAYQVPPGRKHEVKLVQLRAHRRHVLGSDWQRLSTIWNAYFRVPDRITDRAASFGSLDDTLGIHYRGNDKQTSFWDTNPVSPDEYLSIITDFLSQKDRSRFRRIFLATDDADFYQYLKERLPVEIINLGAVNYHKAEGPREELGIKTDRAMLDCVLLSRCGTVLLTSSALPSFTKILNPDLEIYRVAASKFFTNTPYFPVAYIPIYKPSTPMVSALIERLTIGDWTKTVNADLFIAPFDSRPYWPPIVRLVFSSIQRLPGFHWIKRAPTWLAAYREKRRTRVRQTAA